MSEFSPLPSRRRSDLPPTRLIEVRLAPLTVVLLAVVALVLSVISLGLQVVPDRLDIAFRGLASLQGYFGLDREANIPTWFQSGLLGLCALTLWTVADDVRLAGGRRVMQWRLLALVFCYLSLDELASLHERADEPLHRLLHTTGALLWAWVLLAVPLVIVFAIAYLPFLISLPGGTRYGMVLAGAVYVGGAVVAEMIGSLLFTRNGLASVSYQLVATVEEGMEMAGLLILLAVLGRHVATISPDAAPRTLDLAEGDVRARTR